MSLMASASVVNAMVSTEGAIFSVLCEWCRCLDVQSGLNSLTCVFGRQKVKYHFCTCVMSSASHTRLYCRIGK